MDGEGWEAGCVVGVWIGWSLVKEVVMEQSAIADWQDLLFHLISTRCRRGTCHLPQLNFV